LCDGVIDTTTASGELVFHIFTALAQFERRLIQERTNAGLAAARARGRKGGADRFLLMIHASRSPRKCTPIRAFRLANTCRTLRISRPTLYRWLSMK
jgi:DNA invertase Pin-like site-specific DNA recombinase